ncbi:MAG: OmpA family protein [Muribaculaceae bacterium]|nr:OmpA family protein [Muribaculaceae bacterium]
MLRRLLTATMAAAIVLASLTGCVSKKKYAALQAERDGLYSDWTTINNKYNESQAQNQTIQALLDEARRNNEQLRADYATLQRALDQSLNNTSQGSANIAQLVDQINQSNQYIRRLVEAKNRSDSLNMVLTTNLTRSLTPAEMSDVNIKVIKGVVYISLADNMLFRSGSYQINSSAMNILSKIARIIQDYREYSVLVEGNTDNVPISRTNIRNNWDLSALRASSVVQALQNDFGIDPSRLTAGGRGEYNPVATNATADGRQLNRRTEIIITPKLDQFMDLIGQAPAESGTTTPAEAPAAVPAAR